MKIFSSITHKSASTGLTSVEASHKKEDEADVYISAGECDGALQCLTKAIFLRPEYAQLYAKQAQMYWKLGDVKSSIGICRKLLSVEPNPPQRIKDELASLFDTHAYSLLLSGEQPSIVLDYLNEAIQLNAFNEVYWLHRAIAQIEACCYETAVQDVTRCICLNIRDVEYFVLRAELYWRLQMQEKAAADIHTAALLQPDNPAVLEHEQRLVEESQIIYEEARAQLMARQYVDAVENLSRATRLTPEDAKLFMLRASAYRGLSEYHTALRDTEKALSCHRRKHGTCILQTTQPSLLHLSTHDKNQQLAAHRQSNSDLGTSLSDIIKQRSFILNDIRACFLQQKSYQLAVNATNLAIWGQLKFSELFRNQKLICPQYFLSRGDANRGLGNPQAALADYNDALELLPGDLNVRSRIALVHYQFGVTLFNQGFYDKAELEFGNAIGQDPNVPSYYIRRGDTRRFLEKHQAACSDYQQALRLKSSDRETQIKLIQYNMTYLPTASKQHASRIATTAQARSSQQHRSKPNVEEARTLFKRTNNRIQYLFHNRPEVPSFTINSHVGQRSQPNTRS